MDDWSGIGDDIRAALDRAAVTRRIASETRRASEEIRNGNAHLRQALRAQLRGCMPQQLAQPRGPGGPPDERSTAPGPV